MDALRPDNAPESDVPETAMRQSLARLAASAERINAKAGGALQLAVARFQDLPAWVDRLMHGDPQAVAVMQNVAHVAQRIATGGTKYRPTCAECEKPITGGLFSVVTATADGLTEGISATVCGDCGGSDATSGALIQRALPTLRDAFPDLRLLPSIHAPAGHA